MISRRSFSSIIIPAALAGGLWAHPRKSEAFGQPSTALRAEVDAALQAVERRSGGRLGVCIVDTASGAELSHRPDERFLMCSTFKLMASALVLRRVDLGRETLERLVPYGPRDLVPHSPITAQQVSRGAMTMGALCEATITTSDNTAANLILASYGGPCGLTAFLRSIGDPVTRLDRIEPALNAWRPGDPRDTTSPRAMLRSMQRVVLGEVLTPASRHQLQQWLLANTTGATRLRAGIPTAWPVGDKTGKGDGGTTNDIGIVWPTDRAPFLVTAYLTQSKAASDTQDRAIAEVGELLASIASR